MHPRSAGVAALLVALVAAPVLAQTTAPSPAPTPTTGVAADGFDWGLLGLLGLAGLAPLFMRKDQQGNVHADRR